MSQSSFRMPLICILAGLLLTFLLPACAQASFAQAGTDQGNRSTPADQTAPTAPVEPTLASPDPVEIQATQPPASPSGEITLNVSYVAQDKTIETVAAVGGTTDSPYWMAVPEFRQVTLSGYTVVEHSFKPQIFIYPVDDFMPANPVAAEVIANLQSLLQSPRDVEEMPFLPLINAKQVLHAQVQSLAFQNGTGVRFLTQFNQGPVKVNNDQLIYAFQGLTSDGKYYIAAVMPVTHPDLPAGQELFSEDAAEMKNYPAYVTQTAAWLAQQPASSFTPDLAKLDATLASLNVQ
jgi:hypothetical protein